VDLIAAPTPQSAPLRQPPRRSPCRRRRQIEWEDPIAFSKIFIARVFLVNIKDYL
jgi:hypothetical protein